LSALNAKGVVLGSDGIVVRLLETDDEADACARMVSSSEPWLTLGRRLDNIAWPVSL
jgi:hypothetical protein